VTKKKVRKIKAATPGEVKKATEDTGGKAKSSASAGTTAVKRLEPQAEPVGKIAAIKQFLTEVRAELDKITWANRKETTSLTIAVLAITIFFSAYLGLVDIALSKLVGTLIK